MSKFIKQVEKKYLDHLPGWGMKVEISITLMGMLFVAISGLALLGFYLWGVYRG